MVKEVWGTLLERGVRKAASRVRITAQRGNRSTSVGSSSRVRLAIIFDLQDQVTMNVVGAIAPKLQEAEIERAKHKLTESLDAYDYYCAQPFTQCRHRRLCHEFVQGAAAKDPHCVPALRWALALANQPSP
jgi:hypothetical protein